MRQEMNNTAMQARDAFVERYFYKLRYAVKTIRRIRSLDCALNNENQAIHVISAFNAAELRCDRRATIMDRNIQSDKVCSLVDWLNAEHKRYTGKPFLTKCYNYKGVKLHQENIPDMLAMMEDFSNFAESVGVTERLLSVVR